MRSLAVGRDPRRDRLRRRGADAAARGPQPARRPRQCAAHPVLRPRVAARRRGPLLVARSCARVMRRPGRQPRRSASACCSRSPLPVLALRRASAGSRHAARPLRSRSRASSRSSRSSRRRRPQPGRDGRRRRRDVRARSGPRSRGCGSSWPPTRASAAVASQLTRGTAGRRSSAFRSSATARSRARSRRCATCAATSSPPRSPASSAEVLVGGDDRGERRLLRLWCDPWLPIVFVFVLGLSFLLLTLAFRSIVVAGDGDRRSTCSRSGRPTACWCSSSRKASATSCFGFQQVETIEAWVPLFLFAVLFGLSMDYQVFLLSRIRERFTETGRHDEADRVRRRLDRAADHRRGADHHRRLRGLRDGRPRHVPADGLRRRRRAADRRDARPLACSCPRR